MMYNMYCDPLKNLVMFLPDGTSDADVLSLAAAAVPEFSDASIKPTGYIDLFHKHATYPLNEMTPAEFTLNLNLL